jgi:hypothetical protein
MLVSELAATNPLAPIVQPLSVRASRPNSPPPNVCACDALKRPPVGSAAVASVPTAVQLWIFSHECAHLFGEKDENKADCRTVQRGGAAGWLDATGMEQVCEFISAGRPDAAHAVAPTTAILMRRCFREAVSAKGEGAGGAAKSP